MRGRIAAQRGPWPDQHAQRFGLIARSDRRDRSGHAERAQARADRLAGVLETLAHSMRTGRRLPSIPFRNGSGKDPTTAGTLSV